MFIWHLITERVTARRRCRMCGLPTDTRWCGAGCRAEYLAFYEPGA